MISNASFHHAIGLRASPRRLFGTIVSSDLRTTLFAIGSSDSDPVSAPMLALELVPAALELGPALAATAARMDTHTGDYF
jgi:hypothetical protein